MKKLNQNYFTIAVYALAVIAFSLVFLLICVNLGVITSAFGSFFSAIASILYGILFAFLLFPAVKRLDSLYTKLFCKKKERPFLVSGFSITTTLLLTLGVVAALLIVIIPRLLVDAEALYHFITSIKLRLDTFVASHAQTAPFLHDLYLGVTRLFFGDSGEFSLMDTIVSSLSGILSGAIGQISSIFMGLIISVYFLASRRAISSIIGKLVVAILPERHVNRFVMFFKRLYTDFASFAFHRFLIAFFFGGITLLFCYLVNVPLLSAIVLLMLLSHLIPVVGPIIGVSISAALVFVLKGTWWGIAFTAAILALEMVVSNAILPHMLPKKLRPPYAVTAAVVLISLSVFGVIGAFIAVPIYATLNIEVRRFIIHRLAKKKLPLAAESYRDFNASVYEEAIKEKNASEAESADDAPGEEPSGDTP